MQETGLTTITEILAKQRTFFSGQMTKDVSFRLEQLKRMSVYIRVHEQEIAAALKADLNKSYEEAYLTEISIVLQELAYHTKHLKRWIKPQTVETPIHLFPSTSEIRHEPLGIVLIVAPWNYPFQLLMNPLVGAISSGCCAVLKPSPNTPHIAAWMEKMVRDCFNPAHVALVQGGKETNTLLFAQRFDTIFFTGSPKLGKVVMEAASNYLTPVILELGGKSPCVVDASANVALAAKRIAWGKTINAGQTCIAPDYLFVHAKVKDQFIAEYKKQLLAFFGENPQDSAYYPRIVNREALDRLVGYLTSGTIVHGGKYDVEDCYLEPTLMENVNVTDPVMQEEIFGPILPVLTFENLSEVTDYVNRHEKPLAAYYFGAKSSANDFIAATSSGGVCVNDVLLHIANHHLPFGGVGNSGMSAYHGYKSFEVFSHAKAVLRSSSWFDLPVKYVPFKFFKWIKKIL